jgi:predicted TIM-barrel fold metal-dependent hydrolase
MTIDLHSHWQPPALMDALRARTEMPMIRTNGAGVEVLLSGRGEMPLDKAFDSVEKRLADMDAHGISTAVLSLFGMYQWIERLAAGDALPLVRLFNDSTSAICEAHPGRFAFYASLPLADMNEAVTEFHRAMALPGAIGTIVPGNGFLTREDADQFAPIMRAADALRAMVFIHWSPRAGDAWPRVGKDADNFLKRLGTLDMQASLSANMVTLCCTDYLDAYPNATVHIHNLGGNIPFEIERMDHRNYMDTPDLPLPSGQMRRDNLYVDCNSFGARGIEMGVATYGADRIMFGTDGTGFGCKWTHDALDEARISEGERELIRHGNAARLMSHLVPLAPRQQAAE